MFKVIRRAFEENPFGILATVVFLPLFLASWGYFIATFGLMLGIGLGWFPAAVIGALVTVLSPVIL